MNDNKDLLTNSFKVGFKATLGVLAAQLVAGLGFLASIAVIATVSYFIFK